MHNSIQPNPGIIAGGITGRLERMDVGHMKDTVMVMDGHGI
jgi:hypothetical protein